MSNLNGLGEECRIGAPEGSGEGWWRHQVQGVNTMRFGNRDQDPVSRQGTHRGKKEKYNKFKVTAWCRHRALCRIQLLPVTVFWWTHGC